MVLRVIVLLQPELSAQPQGRSQLAVQVPSLPRAERPEAEPQTMDACRASA